VQGCRGAALQAAASGQNALENHASRVRFMIRLPIASDAQVLHCLVEAVRGGEIGHWLLWREHLQRCGHQDGR
jgi:hypothetical protein